MPSTEWGGDDLVPANVQPKPTTALSASEKLRLTYLTGQDSNARAPRDGGRAWNGELPVPELMSKLMSSGRVAPAAVPSAWDGGAWAELDPEDFVRGSVRITVSTDPPSSPAVNDVWIRPL